LGIRILARQFGIQSVHGALGVAHTDTGLQARGSHEPSGAAIRLRVAMPVWRYPYVGTPGREHSLKSGRSDASDGERVVSDPDRPAGDAGIAEEAVTPEPVPQHSERTGFVAGREETADGRNYGQCAEIIVGHGLTQNRLGFGSAADGEALAGRVAEDLVEDPIELLPVLIFGIGDWAARCVLHHHDACRERLEQERVDEAEDCRIGPDADCQAGGCRGRKAGIPAHVASGISEILPQGGQPGKSGVVAARFLCPCQAAEALQGIAPGILLGHTVRLLLRRSHFEVMGEFVLEIPFQIAGTQRRCQPFDPRHRSSFTQTTRHSMLPDGDAVKSKIESLSPRGVDQSARRVLAGNLRPAQPGYARVRLLNFTPSERLPPAHI
jgi:hypothetical protein